MPALTDEQREALGWASATPLVRWTDGLWRGMGCYMGDAEHEHENVRLLAKMGLLEMIPIGAIITDAGREALRNSPKT